MAPILKIDGLTKNFGGITAVNSVDLEVKAGARHSIIGPNGAGKTTLFNLINGMLPANEGQVVFKNKSIRGLKPHTIAGMGLGRTFQTVSLFHSLTVLENVMFGAYVRGREGLLRIFFHRPFSKLPGEEQTRTKALEVLRFLGLEKRKDLFPQDLSFPEQKRLEIARTLALDPDMILLDEPGAGLNANELDELNQVIRRINEGGTTVLLIEHNIRLVMNVSQTISVLNFGQKIAEGTPREIQANQEVVEAYLGED
ncbi:MAG: ABC transporter ATP-binding protein [Deltaproteobacteria bacterium]|nr:ABC transporter ATP-binding protein [Deltaproteobacteria bacterium]